MHFDRLKPYQLPGPEQSGSCPVTELPVPVPPVNGPPIFREQLHVVEGDPPTMVTPVLCVWCGVYVCIHDGLLVAHTFEAVYIPSTIEQVERGRRVLHYSNPWKLSAHIYVINILILSILLPLSTHRCPW